ncbi:Negative regulator of mitotic exit [Cladophialophora chaetospira]|uniref:Negative regulator of mitotic exit n=1 Tax=Cladophialophora chaetospira TaxID=386627 RepID=A0AA39CP71_9EURO|nr:Negative regulator of mitotic exit [Cladophialophora chaetospira]
MAFLFKSRRNAPNASGLPPASRNIHTSDGTSGSTSAPNGGSIDSTERSTQSPQPNAGPNGSLTSMNSLANAPSYPRRERSESESGPRPTTSSQTTQVPNAALYPWSQRRLNFPTPQSNPFPRYGAAVNAVASKDGDIYIMGGLINGSMVRGDLWMVESGAGNLSCYPIATVSEGPGPRVGHASLLVGNAFIVYGGDTKMDDNDMLDDTLYLLNTSSRQWSRASPPGPRPSGRYGHTLNILGSKIYIFGGQVEGYFFNDLVAFDLNALQQPTNQWEFLIQNTGDNVALSAKVPAARTNHTIVSYNDQLFLFGGTNGTQWFNDVWTYSPATNSWTQQDCIGYIPAPREGHSAALCNDVMYIFGGRTEEGTDLGDLAAFRISSKRWYTFQNMGPSPSPRSGHSMTAYRDKIIVLAGEPSSAPRDPAELSMVYVLDTAKIRYPNDAPGPDRAIQGIDRQPSSPTRRPSTEARSVMPTRSTSREGQGTPNAPREQFAGGPVQRPDPAQSGSQSRLPRASMAQAPAGPPPQGQAPNPRMNGVQSPSTANDAQKSRYNGPPVETRGPAAGPNGVRTAPPDGMVQPPAIREVQKESNRPSREGSPNTHGRRTPIQRTESKAKAMAMEAGEAAPLVSSGVARQRSLRSQRAQSSIDSTEDGLLGRSSSARHHSESQADSRNSRSFHGDEPKSPKMNAHQEALLKELETAKKTNAWYASELALARKQGYHSGTASSPTFDDRTVSQVSDDDRPLMEAFMMMRTELVKMHDAMEAQASSMAKRIGEVEHQRDAAVTEAAYARAKLAAHGGSQRSTPQPDHGREPDEQERFTDLSRRLALALAAQSEHKSRLDTLNTDLSSERKARELAEESMDALQLRYDELNKSRKPAELEGLRAELHEAQGLARSEAGRRTEVEEELRTLRVDHDGLRTTHDDVSSRLASHTASLAALEAAVAASTSKAGLFERQIEEERGLREATERKLSQLRAEHEDQTTELEATSKRMRDAEELSETHAKEATTHRDALLAGLAKLSSPHAATQQDSVAEQRMAALRESAEQASALAKRNQEAADKAAQKLRNAEERIAGLEAYQEQSSREALQTRRQLQTALRDAQNYQSQIRDLRSNIEVHQRDTSALAVQHSALKDLLGERGLNVSDVRRSPAFGDHSPTSRFGTPEQARLRELDQQLQASIKAHEETKSQFEARMQEADGTYKEKLEQLENDYQSAVHYVKGTEKMLKKMKEELTKYKSQNAQLTTELETARSTSAASGNAADTAAFENERQLMQSSIEEMKTQTSQQIAQLESNVSSLRSNLAAVQAERDQQRANEEELSQTAQRLGRELQQLKSENTMLEQQAQEAESRITVLLDQVNERVGNYRRQSQLQPLPHGINGLGHNREESTSTMTDASVNDDTLTHDDRGSMALDNLASELETLRSQWESTSRSAYRLSTHSERTPTAETHGAELSDNLASWRRRLAEEEKGSKEPQTVA